MKEIWTWIAEGRVVYMCLLVIIAAVLLGFELWKSEAAIRLAGYSLQLIGMIFAIRGLLRIRTHFTQPSIRNLILDWLKRFPKWTRSVSVSGNLGSATASIHGEVEIWHPDNLDASIDERINAIVANLKILRDGNRQQKQSLSTLKESHERHKMSVEERTNQLKKDLRQDLETLHTSDLITSLVGLVWLTVGITMSTLAPELYQWMN